MVSRATSRSLKSPNIASEAELFRLNVTHTLGRATFAIHYLSRFRAAGSRLDTIELAVNLSLIPAQAPVYISPFWSTPPQGGVVNNCPRASLIIRTVEVLRIRQTSLHQETRSLLYKKLVRATVLAIIRTSHRASSFAARRRIHQLHQSTYPAGQYSHCRVKVPPARFPVAPADRAESLPWLNHPVA
jgi:hypothetical protein